MAKPTMTTSRYELYRSYMKIKLTDAFIFRLGRIVPFSSRSKDINYSLYGSLHYGPVKDELLSKIFLLGYRKERDPEENHSDILLRKLHIYPYNEEFLKWYDFNKGISNGVEVVYLRFTKVKFI